MIVYIYTFPNNKKYVGQTSQTLEKRAKKGEGYASSPAIYSAIKKYGWDNIIIETFTCDSKKEMNELEQYYIQLYQTNNPNYGYNLTIGGEGVLKYERAKIKELWEQGLGVAEIAEKIGSRGETVRQILISEQLYNQEEVHKRKSKRLSATSGEKLKEYYSTPEHHQKRVENGLKGAKVRSKPVIVYKDKQCTQLIGIYESGRQCAKALGIDHSLPSYALTHNHYSSGYYFYFLEDMPARDCTWEKIYGKENKMY